MSMSLHCSGTVLNPDKSDLLCVLSSVYFLSLINLITSVCVPWQVFDNTPAAFDGTLQSGDEIIGVNGISCKGKTKVQAAKMIQASKVGLLICFTFTIS